MTDDRLMIFIDSSNLEGGANDFGTQWELNTYCAMLFIKRRVYERI